MNENQAVPLEPYNVFTSDPVLPAAIEREGAGSATASLVDFAERVGSEEVMAWGFDANRHVPELQTHDRVGDRVDEVSYHPSYHSLLALSL